MPHHASTVVEFVGVHAPYPQASLKSPNILVGAIHSLLPARESTSVVGWGIADCRYSLCVLLHSRTTSIVAPYGSAEPLKLTFASGNAMLIYVARSLGLCVIGPYIANNVIPEQRLWNVSHGNSIFKGDFLFFTSLLTSPTYTLSHLVGGESHLLFQSCFCHVRDTETHLLL